MIYSWLISASRLLDYIATLFLLGSIFFDVIIRKGIWNRKRIKTLFFSATITTLIYMILSAADMADTFQFKPLWFAMSKTSFGHWWCFRFIVLFLGAILITIFNNGILLQWILLFCAAIVPLIGSLTGHPASSETWVVTRIALDYIHSVAVAVWVGGLYGVYFYVADAAIIDQRNMFPVVKRFSHFAMVSTGLIMCTGLLQVYLMGDSFKILWNSFYGKGLVLKVLVFSGALFAAAINEFFHMRRFKAGYETNFANSLRREVRIEIIIILVVLGLTSVLTRMNLPGL